MPRCQVVAAALLGLVACGEGPSAVDGGNGSLDSGPSDAGASADAGGGDGGGSDAGPVDAGAQDSGISDSGIADGGAFQLASTALAEGGTFPVRYTCTDANTTGHISPPLSWGPSAAANSYALVMTDVSINLIHWVIFDIPAASRSLPEGVENAALPAAPAGAKQTTSYDNSTRGYRGPCPPTSHLYRFQLYAVDVATLPGVTTASTRAQAKAAIEAHAAASSSLSANYGP